MTVLGSPIRPLARLVVRAAAGGQPARARRHAPPYSPPESGRAPPAATLGHEQLERVQLAEWVLFGLLAHRLDDTKPVPSAVEAMASDVVVWSPAVCATSRDEAVADLGLGDEDDDALTDVRVEVLATDVVDERVYLEWRLTARFTNACFIDDDLLVEPTGRLVETSGVQVATFRGGMLTRVNCYYDDLALLEQLVT